MDKRKLTIFAAVAAVLLVCVGGAVMLTGQSDNDPDVSATTNGTVAEAPTVDETEPELPTQRWQVDVTATWEDGSVVQGAAVIATDSYGRRKYGLTNEEGVVTLDLIEGKQSLRFLQDGQRGALELDVSGPSQENIQLKDDRVLYVLLGASGTHDIELHELEGFSILEEGIRSAYPDAVYIDHEDRYGIQFHDGDALLSVEVLVEYDTVTGRYHASEVSVDLRTYQETVTLWDMDEAGVEVDIEYVDGNVCSVKVRSEYDYEYKDSASIITGSYYTVQKEWYLSKHSDWADTRGYGYTTDPVLSTSVERRVDAPGKGMEMEAYLTDVASARFGEYLKYAEQVFPYVDLWMTGDWNDGIEQLASAQ